MTTKIEHEGAVFDFPEEEQEIVDLLIRSTQKEIQADHDREEVNAQYRTFLTYIKRKIVDSDLTIEEGRERAKLSHSNYSTRFKRITSLAPRDYIKRHRFNLAKRILRYTTAKVHVVAFAVGFENQNHFSNSYHAVIGYPPSQEEKAPREETLALLEELRLSNNSATALDPKISVVETVDDLEVSGLEDFWTEIETLDREQAKLAIIERSDSITLDHFYFLLQKCKIEGRKKRGRRVDLAHNALDALRAFELFNGRDFLDQKILGYTNLANAYRLNFELEDAKSTFSLVDHLMPRNPAEKPALAAHVSYFRSVLLWWLRDGSSVQSIEDALPDVRRFGSPELLARALQLAGEIYECTGHSDKALPMFEEAVEHSKFVGDPHVVLSANYNLAYLYARLSKGERAGALYRKVLQLSGDLGEEFSVYTTLLEGAVFRANGNLTASERSLLQAREHFLDLELDIYVALTALELALLYTEMQQPQEAFQMAIGSIDCLSRYSHREAVAALAVLHEAKKAECVSRNAIVQALYHVELVRKDPAIFKQREQ